MWTTDNIVTSHKLPVGTREITNRISRSTSYGWTVPTSERCAILLIAIVRLAPAGGYRAMTRYVCPIDFFPSFWPNLTYGGVTLTVLKTSPQ
jgi:hypothetical protein